MTSNLLKASACPSANMMQVRPWWRFEGHSVGVVGSMLPSNEPSGLLSPSMIISDDFFTFESFTSGNTSTSPPKPNAPPAGKDPQSLKPYEKRDKCVIPKGSLTPPGAIAPRELFRLVSHELFG